MEFLLHPFFLGVKMKTKNNVGGFSLIELLLVLAIIGIIAIIAIPNLLSAKRAANEASAQSSLRTIHSCELTYQATDGLGDYGDLAALTAVVLTDGVLGSGTKSGYHFVVNPTAPGVRPALFYATAVPNITVGLSRTGTRRFGITEDGIIHGDAIALTPYTDAADVRAATALGN